MKVAVHAVGRMKAGPERQLAERYLERFAKSGPGVGLDYAGLTELAESRQANVALRRKEEAERLTGALADQTVLVLLDESGREQDSQAFAKSLAIWRDEGRRSVLFAIGGADGHDRDLHARATAVLSFGRLTWPHQLVRIMLAEQLYRATTILSGHPYHRS